MNLDTIVRQTELKTFYRDGDYLIKVMNENYPQSEVLKEALNQTRANELGLPSPKVHEVCKIGNRWAIVSDFIEGDNITHLIHNHPEKTEEYICRMVNLQFQIFSNISYLFGEQTSRIHHAICMSNVDAITRFQLHETLSKIQVHHHVCHGDFVPSNVMVGPDGKMTVLDWSRAGQGDPVYDIATTYLQIKVRQEDEALAELYLDWVTRKSSYTREQIFEFLPVVAIVLSTVSKAQRNKDKFIKYFSNNK